MWVSAITPWEIGMLVAKGRLVLDRDVMDWLQAALALPGIRVAPLDPAVAVASTRLPGELHGDPADRRDGPPPGCDAGHGRRRLAGVWPARARGCAVGKLTGGLA